MRCMQLDLAARLTSATWTESGPKAAASTETETETETQAEAGNWQLDMAAAGIATVAVGALGASGTLPRCGNAGNCN